MSAKPSSAGAVGRSTKAAASGSGGGGAAGSTPKTTKSTSSSATATSKASKSKKKTSKSAPAPASLPPTDEQLEAAATAREEARAHLRIQQRSRLMYFMLQIQREDDRSRAAAAAAKAAEVEQRQRKALLFESAFDNDRDGCMSALGVSQDLCPTDGDGVFDFPDGTTLALAVDTKNAAGATAASEAAVAGAHDALLLLLRCGADVETTDDHGRTPLFRSCFMKRTSCSRLLLDWGARPNAVARSGEDCSSICQDPELLPLLLDWNPDDAAARRRSKGSISHAMSHAATVAAAAEGVMCSRHPRAIRRYCICQGDERMALVPIKSLQIMLDTMRVTQRACIGDVALCHMQNRYFTPVPVVDVNERATTYLRYIDSNYLQFCKPDDLEPDIVRMAALGAVRYGKPLVLDCSEVALHWQDLSKVFDCIEPGLFVSLTNGSFIGAQMYMALVRPGDGSAYEQQSSWLSCDLSGFQFVVVSRVPDPAEEFQDCFFVMYCG